jgi:hypothetical protein
MSDADLQPEVTTRTIPAQQQRVNNSHGQMFTVENAITAQLNAATNFPVRYTPPKEMLTNSSGRMTLSIVRARLEKNWDVKQIDTQLGEDTEKTFCWLISRKQVLEETQIGKRDDDLDDIDLKEVLGPMMGKFKY